MNNSSDSRKLLVYVGNELMGIVCDIDGFWSFEYESKWLNTAMAFPLCPDIPLEEGEQLDTGTKRPVQRFFDNLLPEENARILLAREIDIPDPEDSFLLLAHSGQESAGALTLLKEDVNFPSVGGVELSDAELSLRIKNLPKAPLNNRKASRMSLAGAQHKMLVIFEGNKLFEPEPGTPSTHILKPDHSTPLDYWQTTRNEWFVMKLAKKMGLDVPDVKLFYVPEPVYLIKRFDRIGDYPNQERRHIVDACQLLGYGRGAKYSSSKMETYANLLKEVRPPAIAALKLYQWVIFNLVVGNGDAHLKNISFYQLGNYAQLAPFYDLLSTVIYVPEGTSPLEEKVSVPINGKLRFCDVRKEDILAFADSFGIPKKLALRTLTAMLSNIEHEASTLYTEVGSLAVCDARAGEMRMLRQIEHLVVKEMVNQLS